MDYYHIWADPIEGTDAKDFAIKMKRFLDQLVKMNKMESYKLTRMKLGFRSMDIPEFHIMMQFKNMQQLDNAMTAVLNDEEKIEDAHVGFNQMVDIETIQHALYRDYPDE
jgi:hypothetical protein